MSVKKVLQPVGFGAYSKIQLFLEEEELELPA